MREFKNWYICVNGKVDIRLSDASQAYDIYNWMITNEGREENLLNEEDVITIHGVHCDRLTLEKRLAQQKAWDEMLKNGIA